MIAAGEITPILPSTSEKMPDNITKYFLDHLLNYMVSEVSPLGFHCCLILFVVLFLLNVVLMGFFVGFFG